MAKKNRSRRIFIFSYQRVDVAFSWRQSSPMVMQQIKTTSILAFVVACFSLQAQASFYVKNEVNYFCRFPLLYPTPIFSQYYPSSYNIESIQLPKSIFCKWENQLSSQSKTRVCFRLGSLEYTNGIEYKPYLQRTYFN